MKFIMMHENLCNDSNKCLDKRMICKQKKSFYRIFKNVLQKR